MSDNKEKEIEEWLERYEKLLEPETHCCECTPGPHYTKHLVHIQYLECNCDPNNFVLNKNKKES